MARNEADREDLWAEAIGLSERAELRITGFDQPLLAGFRDTGVFSVYFGQDVMLQFTPDGGLRRAFREGTLYRSGGRTLAQLKRHRSESTSELLRHDLAGTELRQFRDWVLALLSKLETALANEQFQVLRLVPDTPAPFIARLQGMLAVIRQAESFLSPAINARR